MTRMLPCLALLALACACASRPQEATHTFDLGLVTVPPSAGLHVDVRPVEAPDWLNRNAMLYRLAYRDARALEPYARSRWAGSPPAMLTLRLQQSLGDESPRTAACTLSVNLEEFSQVFDSESGSRAVLHARANLRQAGESRRSESTVLRLEQATQTPDAKGGAAAFSALADEFTYRIAEWVAGVCPAKP
jgi:cholesterol transport system auxiliary component